LVYPEEDEFYRLDWLNTHEHYQFGIVNNTQIISLSSSVCFAQENIFYSPAFLAQKQGCTPKKYVVTTIDRF